MKFSSDIDIDFADREKILDVIQYTTAAIRKDDSVRKHNTGVYVTAVPYDPINHLAAIDYTEAENRGYVKLDFLNIWVYQYVKDENHLNSLLVEPDWELLLDREFFKKLIHIGNHYDKMIAMPERIDSIARMAMFLSIIRPGAKHLLGLPWNEVAKSVWTKSEGGYTFKKSHAVAYAHLLVVHMNLLKENPKAFSLPE